MQRGRFLPLKAFPSVKNILNPFLNLSDKLFLLLKVIV